jgi:hypothetical protein
MKIVDCILDIVAIGRVGLASPALRRVLYDWLILFCIEMVAAGALPESATEVVRNVAKRSRSRV